MKESHKPETMERYGHGTPDDWIERNVYTPMNKYGILLTLALQMTLFGVIPGFIMWGVQMLWIPFWAAGVINGIGHYWGYRNFETDGRGAQHHALRPVDRRRGAAQQPPRLPDLGQVLDALARVRPRLAATCRCSRRWASRRCASAPPKVKLDPTKFEIDAATLQAVIQHRYDVLAQLRQAR